MADKQVQIYQFQSKENGALPSFFAVSTTPINVDSLPGEPEDDTEPVQKNILKPVCNSPEIPEKLLDIEEIVRQLLRDSPSQPELIIAIHGYSSSFQDVEEWYTKIWRWLGDTNNGVTAVPGRVFLGYRWPAEFVAGTSKSSSSSKIAGAWNALPRLPQYLLIGGLAGVLLTIVGLFGGLWFPVGAVLIGVAVFLATIIMTLMLLRLIVYFRDTYRAFNVAVLDLVEIFRQIDYLLQKDSGWQKHKLEKSGTPRVKLNFIGHSLGCGVIANLVRILTDVFDPLAIEKMPTSEISKELKLGRLVLVAPDIPVEFVMPRQANYLQSALRRCEEAYVFCNEGDLALRLASTAANYIGFPARTRVSGYRLGNITVDRQLKTEYGIVNLEALANQEEAEPYYLLEVRASSKERHRLTEIVPDSETQKRVADLFTYFDCTDYRDKSGDQGLVSEALRKGALEFWDYLSLLIAFLQRSVDKNKGIDTHGGYFQGTFSSSMIYQLAFLGFQGLLANYDAEASTSQQKLQVLSRECETRGIQVVLAPERYQTDVLGTRPNRFGY
jgi:hypothetical protein